MKKNILNKKNAIKFADKIYNKETGEFTKLCVGELVKNGMCCALGEAGTYFLGKSIVIENEDWPDTVCTMLIRKAKKKHPNKDVWEHFANLININDTTIGYEKRARKIRKYWMENIVPLLK